MNVPVAKNLEIDRTGPRRWRSLCGNCYLVGECERAKAKVPNLVTIRDPLTRQTYQNHIVRLRMSYHALIDYHINSVSEFLGGFEDQDGRSIPAPSFAAMLTPGAEYWFREQIAGGEWRGIEDVPHLRREAIGRWRIIGTVIDIKETVQPICPPR